MSDERAGINWVQVAAAALAAVSSAVLLSTLGVAGTLIGAALGSITASIGSSIYGRGLDLSKQQVAVQAAALRRVTAARENLDKAQGGSGEGDLSAQARLGTAEDELDEAERVLSEAAGGEGEGTSQPGAEDASAEAVAEDRSRREVDFRKLPWKRIAVLAAVVFIGVMGVITGFEVVTGRAVSAYTGGSSEGTRTTFTGVTKDVEGKKSKPTETPTESPTGEATTGASETTAPSEPTESPSEQPSTTVSAEPTPSESVTPTELPTELPTVTPSVTPTEVPTPTDAPPSTE